MTFNDLMKYKLEFLMFCEFLKGFYWLLMTLNDFLNDQ